MASEEELIRARRAKFEKLEQAGTHAFPNTFKGDEGARKYALSVANDETKRAGLPMEAELSGSEQSYALFGRVIAKRGPFVVVRTPYGDMQALVRKDRLPEAAAAQLAALDLSDFVAVTGPLIRTGTGAAAVRAEHYEHVSKALLPPPDKWHGLTDVEKRYRERYVNLFASPEVAHVFRARSLIVRELRRFLDELDFLEVETPVLQAVRGGATAKPFNTHHNALDHDFYLRIAPELFLKRLLVGGLERVYELGRVFRNEGVSARHNPEFTILEFYMAYASCDDLVELTEALLRAVDAALLRQFPSFGNERPFSLALPFARVTMRDAIVERVARSGEEGLSATPFDGALSADVVRSADALLSLIEQKRSTLSKELSAVLRKCTSHGERIFALYEHVAEPDLAKLYRTPDGAQSLPVFILEYPFEVSPLARRNDREPAFVDRFELFIEGREVANAFSELNDPEDQAARFRAQLENRARGDEEAMDYDADYVRALSYGMPPAGGFGLGVDRLVMLLCNQPSIRDVLLFSGDATGGAVNAARKLRGWALALSFASAGAVGLTALTLTQPAWLDLLRAPQKRPILFAALSGFALLAVLALIFALRSQRTQRGTPGRLRLGVLGYATFLFAASDAAALGLLAAVADKLPIGAPVTLDDTLWLLPSAYRGAVGLIGTLLAASAVVALGALIASWFLLPRLPRRIVFIVVDTLTLTAFIVLSLRYEFAPVRLTPEALTGASLRLGATLLLAVRMFIRLLPWLLSAIERINFRTLVAARHLRAKKSGFLAAISFLSILAVSVSSCALTTTLSVMGGFRQDLKRKILGNNAHIVVDPPQGRLPNYDKLAATVRGVEGVRGVSPYVSGEVMISSASNLAGAVLRGIDLEHIGEVSELPRSMRVGSLTYLAEPEKLKDLPANQLGLNVAPPKSARADSESEVKPGKSARLSDEIDEALRRIEPTPRVNTAPSLPGIVVGQELARSLRLYLGDEVNVVTPLGELGPTGPLPKSRSFRVAGIFYSGMYEYDMKFAYVTLASAQRFLGSGDNASGVEITVREPDRAQDIAVRIAEVVPKGLRVRPWQELNRNLFGALALEKLAMFIALGIAILVASFCIIGTLTLMVQEKGREVAVLKAMGAADGAIVTIFVLEGTLIGVLGSLLGLGFGYAMCFAAEHFGVRLNPEVYYIDKLPVHIDSTEFFTVAIAATLVSLLVTIYPAKLASRLRPVDALRYE